VGRFVELIVSIISIGLQNAGEVSKMPKGMFAPPVAACVIECCRWRAAAKGLVVADIGPDVALDRLPFARIGIVVSSP
jgi:hypothetical protein